MVGPYIVPGLSCPRRADLHLARSQLHHVFLDGSLMKDWAGTGLSILEASIIV